MIIHTVIYGLRTVLKIWPTLTMLPLYALFCKRVSPGILPPKRTLHFLYAPHYSNTQAAICLLPCGKRHLSHCTYRRIIDTSRRSFVAYLATLWQTTPYSLHVQKCNGSGGYETSRATELCSVWELPQNRSMNYY
jgi:hypothetical protein